jgi:hypothetical protein
MSNFEAKQEQEQQSRNSTLRFYQSKNLDLFLPVGARSASVLGTANNVVSNPSDRGLTVDRDWVSNLERFYDENRTQGPQTLNLVGIFEPRPIEEMVEEIIPTLIFPFDFVM